MRRALLLIALAGSLVACRHGRRVADAPHLRVLWIGNSYVFVNDLPGMVARLAATRAHALIIDSAAVTVGSATLEQHWNTGTAPARVGAERWDAVVMQGQSVEALTQPNVFHDYATRFGELAATAGARPVYYATWARRPGDALYARRWTGGAPDAMAASLDEAYGRAAAAVQGGVVARVGAAFERARATGEATVLYADDGSHPSVAGTYLAACVLLTALTGEGCDEQSEVPTGIDGDAARRLRAIAAQ